jgi:hypothetical protein
MKGLRKAKVKVQMDNFIFFPSTDPQHETDTLVNMTRVYEGLHLINFRPNAICMVHRHCLLALQVSYGDGVQIHMSGKERILRFIDGIIMEADRGQIQMFQQLRETVKNAEPKKFSFEELREFEQEQQNKQEREM